MPLEIKHAYRTKTYSATLTVTGKMAMMYRGKNHGWPMMRPEIGLGEAKFEFPGGMVLLKWYDVTAEERPTWDWSSGFFDGNVFEAVLRLKVSIGGQTVHESELERVLMDYTNLSEPEANAICNSHVEGDRIESHSITKTITFSASGQWDLMGDVLLANSKKTKLTDGHPDNSSCWDYTRNLRLSERGPGYDSAYAEPYAYTWSISGDVTTVSSQSARFATDVSNDIVVRATAGWGGATNYGGIYEYFELWREDSTFASISWSMPGATSMPADFSDSKTERDDDPGEDPGDPNYRAYSIWCNVSGRSISVGGHGDYWVDASQDYSGWTRYYAQESAPQHTYTAHFDDYDMDGNLNTWGAIADVDASNNALQSVNAGGSVSFNYAGEYTIFRLNTPARWGLANDEWTGDDKGSYIGPLTITNTEALDQPYKEITDPYYKIIADNRVPVTPGGELDTECLDVIRVAPNAPGQWFDFVDADLIATGCTLTNNLTSVEVAASAGDKITCEVFPKHYLNGCRFLKIKYSADHADAIIKLKFNNNQTFTLTAPIAGQIYEEEIDLIRPAEFMTRTYYHEGEQVALATPVESAHPYQVGDVWYEVVSPVAGTQEMRLVFDEVPGLSGIYADLNLGDYLYVCDADGNTVQAITVDSQLTDPISPPITSAAVPGNKIRLLLQSMSGGCWGFSVSNVKVSYEEEFDYKLSTVDESQLERELPYDQFNQHNKATQPGWGVDTVELLEIEFVTAGNFNLYDMTESRHAAPRLLLTPQAVWTTQKNSMIYPIPDVGLVADDNDDHNDDSLGERRRGATRGGISLVDGKVSGEWLFGLTLYSNYTLDEEWEFLNLRLYSSGNVVEPWVRPFDSLPVVPEIPDHEHVNNSLSLSTFSTHMGDFHKSYAAMDGVVCNPLASDILDITWLAHYYQADLVSMVTSGQFGDLSIRGRKVYGSKVVGILYNYQTPAVNAQIKLQTGIGTTHERTEILTTNADGVFESSGRHVSMGKATLEGVPINLINRHHHAYVLVRVKGTHLLLLYDQVTGKLHYRPATGRLEYLS